MTAMCCNVFIFDDSLFFTMKSIVTSHVFVKVCYFEFLITGTGMWVSFEYTKSFFFGGGGAFSLESRKLCQVYRLRCRRVITEICYFHPYKFRDSKKTQI